jgi:hypothetical protein
VLVQLAGYEPIADVVSTSENETASLSLPLEPAHGRSRRSVLAGGLVVGGAIAVAAGTYVSLTDEGIQTLGKVNEYRYSGPAIAVAAVGVAAIGLGVYLWGHPTKRSAPVASISRTGAFAGWGTSF